MNIAVAGQGYVGLSLSVLLAQQQIVKAYDIDSRKVAMINDGKSPIRDAEISDYLANKELNLEATIDPEEAFASAEIIVIAAPTNYDDVCNHFDTSAVEEIIDLAQDYAPEATIIIKSTVPVGFTQSMQEKYDKKNIIFSPEFLREGKALYDNLHPSRIVIGAQSKEAKFFADLMVEGALDEDIPVLFTDSTEAEAIKLFSNTYLALRISYFNELDTFAEVRGLDTKQIIEGVCLDPRIGMHYNNPSFGYGGYCLPKDTKQLLANYQDVPQNLIEAVITSNKTRKQHIVDTVVKLKPRRVGIYRLSMKRDSDNYRTSAILDIMDGLKEAGIDLVVYEPTFSDKVFVDWPVINDFDSFADQVDLILANRMTDELEDYADKVYSRDIFNEN